MAPTGMRESPETGTRVVRVPETSREGRSEYLPSRLQKVRIPRARAGAERMSQYGQQRT